MKELSLHILDIAKNSVKAKADKIQITIEENEEKNLLSIVIEDNGCGMSEEFLKTVNDVEYSIVYWPMNVIRLRSASKENIITEANKIINFWDNYENKEIYLHGI